MTLDPKALEAALDVFEIETKINSKSLKHGLSEAISAYLSTGGEAETTVTLSRVGWEEIDGVKTFTATAVFSEPPNWPANVVWQASPVRMVPLFSSEKRS